MAPSQAKADEAYGQAVSRLQAACILLERHLPPVDPTEVQEPLGIPPLRPAPRVVAEQVCQDCERELEEVPAGNRDGHQCTHGEGGEARVLGQVDQPETPVVRVPRRGQHNPGVVRQDLTNLDNKFDAFAGAIATMITLQQEQADQRDFEQHFVVWTEYYGWMKDRAEYVINMIETANTVAANTLANVRLPANTLQPGTSKALGQTQVLVSAADVGNGDNADETALNNATTGGSSNNTSNQATGGNSVNRCDH